MWRSERRSTQPSKSHEALIMMTMKAFITRYSAAAYFALTFGISWGGFLLVVGSGGFASTSWHSGDRRVLH